MKYSLIAAIFACLAELACASESSEQAALKAEVAATERAFAKTMANRDHAAFAEFVASDAIFFSSAEPLRGKQRVVEEWAKFFVKTEAPLSWEPETVEVLDSGNLALSSGPVRVASGQRIATFTSIWRRETGNKWRVVFDKGSDVCACGKR